MRTVLASADAALLLLGISGATVFAQPSNSSADIPTPESPTNYPMEAIWVSGNTHHFHATLRPRLGRRGPTCPGDKAATLRCWLPQRHGL